MKTASTSSKLGVNQAALLRSLVSHRSLEGDSRWTPHCGWVWTSIHNTRQMLDTMVKRGLVQVTIEKNPEGSLRWTLRGAEYPVYTPTDLGRAWVAANPR